MNIEDLKKKYGTDSIVLMIDELLRRVQLSPYAEKMYEELKQDLRSVLK